MSETIDFYLPLGLIIDGEIYRKGSMHLATTLDELEIQTSDDVGMNSRYRDIILLSRVIDNLEGIGKVTPTMIEELYEADFLYLQILFKELNGELDSTVKTRCPNCNAESPISIPGLYKDMSPYKHASESKRS